MSAIADQQTSSVFTDFWQDLGVEISIFAATVFFSIALKVFMNAHTVKPRRSKCKFERAAPEPESLPAEVVDSSPRTRPKSPREITDIMSGDARSAVRSWKNLQNRGMKVRDVADQPQEVYVQLIRHAARGQYSDLVKQVLEEMIAEGVPRSLEFYERCMKILAGAKHPQQAIEMFNYMAQEGFEPSAVTYSCLISFAAEVGDLNRAVTFFQKLNEKEVPSIRAYMTILRVHGKRSDWTSTLAVFDDMQKRGVVPDTLVLNVVLGTGVALDKVGPLTSIFESFDRKANPITDLVSYNTFIKGLAQRGRLNKVMEIIERMRQRGFEPNAISFNTAMDAAIRAKDANKAWGLLQKMRDEKMNPDKYSVSILAKGVHCAASPAPQHIRDLIRLLRELAQTCDYTVIENAYQTVVAAAAKINQRDLIVLAFAQMRRDGFTPSASSERLLEKFNGSPKGSPRSSEGEPKKEVKKDAKKQQVGATAATAKSWRKDAVVEKTTETKIPESKKLETAVPETKASPPWRQRKPETDAGAAPAA